jgi:hypothetical protein
VRGHMRVGVPLDKRFAILEAVRPRAAPQMVELGILRADVTDLNLPRQLGGLDLAFAARRISGIPVIMRR